MKMKKNSLPVALRALSACILIVPFLSCGFFGIPNYELTVTIKDGVKGTPESGQHPYKDLTEVEYSYTADNYLHTVEVIYDGAQIAASGTFTIYNNVALEARLVDIRDTWTVKMYDAGGAFLIAFDVTFSGADILGGTFTDTRGLGGTWSNGDVTGSWTAART